MEMLERLEYTLKAGIGGAGAGFAGAGGLSFIPSLSVSLTIAGAMAVSSALLFSIYVYRNI
ncbi:hypothetical protein [Vibrio vulnificus]|uniref:hypothetical protein n=1 Tax=Vibrio vulnificus TaxID=672 RepID=UPI001CC9A445|nr:hypothetical protein [Vibrio vulnificus]MCA0763146.1 hypothetical protein [Vibrio vulnificus]